MPCNSSFSPFKMIKSWIIDITNFVYLMELKFFFQHSKWSFRLSTDNGRQVFQSIVHLSQVDPRKPWSWRPDIRSRLWTRSTFLQRSCFSSSKSVGRRRLQMANLQGHAGTTTRKTIQASNESFSRKGTELQDRFFVKPTVRLVFK